MGSVALEVRDLQHEFPSAGRALQILRGLDLDVGGGEGQGTGHGVEGQFAGSLE